MKVFSPLLALYMMAVFLVPCADTLAETAFQDHNHSEELVHQNSHDAPETADLCSPFCICTCCGTISGIVFRWKAIGFPEVKEVAVSKPSIGYISQFTGHYFGEIWHPPKIVA